MKEYIIPAEVYSRVSGYFRPVAQWNYGKQEEFSNRKMLEVKKSIIRDQNINVERE